MVLSVLPLRTLVQEAEGDLILTQHGGSGECVHTRCPGNKPCSEVVASGGDPPSPASLPRRSWLFLPFSTEPGRLQTHQAEPTRIWGNHLRARQGWGGGLRQQSRDRPRSDALAEQEASEAGQGQRLYVTG